MIYDLLYVGDVGVLIIPKIQEQENKMVTINTKERYLRLDLKLILDIC
jgi:hypothetical protein